MNIIKREKCVICNNNTFEEIKNINNFPVYMGVNIDDEVLFNDLKFISCKKCYTIQLKELIPLDILYKHNHNKEVVGQLWKDHNLDFSRFISEDRPAKVIEIGDPSFKLFTLLRNNMWLKKWTIIEPNPLESKDKKLRIIKNFFDNKFKIRKNNLPNAYVLSHVFEHLYEPDLFMKKIDLFSRDDTALYLSIPNMNHMTNEQMLPPAGLCFEHSYYVDLDNIKIILNNNNFDIKKIEYFKNHSIFIKAIKKCDKNLYKINKNFKNEFLFIIKKYENIVNKIINLKEIYIYGAHFQSQFFIKLGLKEENIINVLDNSSSKENKKLYGTNLIVKNPSILKNKGRVYVVCHMGPYTDEIKRQLLEINSEVEFV